MTRLFVRWFVLPATVWYVMILAAVHFGWSF